MYNKYIISTRSSKTFFTSPIQIQIQILYCINSLQSQEGGAIMTEKT